MKLVPWDARVAFTSQHTDAHLVELITLYPVDGGDPIRICNSPVEFWDPEDPRIGGITSRGERFQFLAARMALPDSSRDALPATAIEVDNLDPAAVDALRSSVFRARLDLETVLSSRPDEVIEAYPSMETSEGYWNDDVVGLTVGYENLNTTPLTKHRMTVTVFGALRNYGQ